MLTGLHHVGQIVDDYEATLAFYRDVLGVSVIEEDDIEGAVRLAFTELPDCQVHLIAREQRGSDIDDLLDTLLEVSPYHVAYTVTDIEDAIDHVETAGYAMYDTEPTSGLGPYRRAFADPERTPGIPFEFIELTDTE